MAPIEISQDEFANRFAGQPEDKINAEDVSFIRKHLIPAIAPTIGATGGAVLGAMGGPVAGVVGGVGGGLAGGYVGGKTYGTPGALIGGGLGVAGGVLAGAAGGPIIGGGLGGAAGEYVNQRLGITPTPKTMGEQAFQLGTSAAIGMGTEFGAPYILRPIKRITGPYMRRVTEVGKDIINEIGDFLPSQVTNSGWWRTIEKLVEQSFTGETTMVGFKAGQKQKIENITDAIVNSIGGEQDREIGGQIVMDAITKNNSIFRDTARLVYKDVDNLAQGFEVAITDVKSWATQELKRKAVIPKSLQGHSGNKILNELSALPDSIPFEQAQTLRSELLAASRNISSTEARKDVAASVMKQSSKLVDNAIDKAGSQLNPDALDAWRIANQYYKEGAEIFNDALVRKLVQRDPEFIATSFIKPGAVTAVRMVKKAVGPGDWKTVQTQFLKDLIDKSMKTEGGERVLIGQSLEKLLDKYGQKTIQEIMPVITERQIRRLARITTSLQKESVVPLYTLARNVSEIQTTIVGGAAGYAIGGQAGAYAGMLAGFLSPGVLAGILTNPKAANWLIQGLAAKSTKMVMRAVTFSAMPRPEEEQ